MEICSVTAEAMAEQAATIGQLPQGRLHMELSSLLGYGAAERSLALMWRLGVLDMLLPQQALYLRVGGAGGQAFQAVVGWRG